MGGTLLKVLTENKLFKPEHVHAYDKDKSRLADLPEGVNAAADAVEAVSNSDIIFLCVKPKDMEGLLREVGGRCSGRLLVSIAAGVSTKFIEKHAPDARVIRVMPNTPALVGEMAAAYSRGGKATKEDCKLLEKLFNPLGLMITVDEKLMDAVTGLSGSGPAYIYYVIKALAEGGVNEGMDAETALKLAVQTVKGAAVMVEETRKSPEELIDMVRSPGGTTVEGLKTLDGYRAGEAFSKAVSSAAKRSRELGV
jgi:pyrroline-5-carboxylate reductase